MSERPPERPHTRLASILVVVFTLSGFSGLIYESIWTHYLKLFLGHAAYAQTLVLAIFMGGMAVGSWLSARGASRWKNLVRGYAFAEGLIGVAAFVFDPVFRGFVNLAFDTVLPGLPGSASVTLFKWTSAALLILPQAILLGMTFPLMSAGLVRRYPQAPGRTLAVLYFANSLGGAVGVLISGFLLIRWIGLPGTMRFAGVINVLLALIVLKLAGRGSEPAPRLDPAARESTRSNLYWVLLGVALLTGAASFIYEIAWIRMLSLVLGSSTHAFELMLSAFILGLALGGFWVRGRIDRNPDPLRFLGIIQIVMGLLAVATLPLYLQSFDVMTWLLGALERTETGYLLFNVASHGIALAVMLPATFCAGTTLPLVTFLLLREGYGEKSIGLVYASNTVGAILGVFFAVHVGMTVLGLKGLLTFGAAMDIVVGLYLMVLCCRRTQTYRSLAVAGLSLVALSGAFTFVDLDALTLASGVFAGADRIVAADDRVLESSDGKTATIALTGKPGGRLTIRTNGKPDASIETAPGGTPTVDEVTNVLVAAVPMMVHPDATNAAVIGIGSGVTSHVLLGSPRLESVDTVEIEAAMVEVARGFGERNARVYSDLRSRITIEDAKTFFWTERRAYDVIVSEPSNPWVSGVAGLFSIEFYQTLRRHLAPEGVLVQWLQVYEMDLPLVASVLDALSTSFDDYVVFAANFGDLIVVARRDGPVQALSDEVFEFPELASELARVGIRSLQDVEMKRVGGRRFLAPLLDGYDVPANSDYFPVVDQRAARARFLGSSAQGLIGVLLEPVPVLETLTVTDRSWERSRFEPSDHYGRLSPFYEATLLRDLVLSGKLGSSVRTSSMLRDAEIRTRKRYQECLTIPPHGDRVFVLLEVARATSAYLRPGELNEMWEALSSSPCISELTGPQRDWFDLVEVVSARDPDAMARLATKLLHSGQGITSGRQKYLLAVAMTGLSAVGERAACRELWARSRNESFGVEEPPVVFRLLAAHCGMSDL